MSKYEVLINVFAFVAAIIAIADFLLSNSKIGHKIIICILVAFLGYFAYDNTINWSNKKAKIEKNTALENELIKDAKSVYYTIIISGWEDTGDFLDYLSHITGFYIRHSDIFSVEAGTYEKELVDWRAYFSEKRNKRETIYGSEVNDLRGLVNAGKDNLLSIIENRKSKKNT